MSAKTPEQQMAARSRRAFLTLGAGGVCGFAGWQWLRSTEKVDGLSWPFRRVLEANEKVTRAYFSEKHLAPVFHPSQVTQPTRVNGDIGLGGDPELESWRLTVRGPSGGAPRRLTLRNIQELPKTEQITQLNCIEGWTVIVRWAGVRFADFTAKYASEWAAAPYVHLQTPDEEYFVGLDMPSALHPQTLLCYEMNGKPLMVEHGAPLRLVIPVKYGIKSIKRIGTITYMTARPNDYWADEGYDWYAGL